MARPGALGRPFLQQLTDGQVVSRLTDGLNTQRFALPQRLPTLALLAGLTAAAALGGLVHLPMAYGVDLVFGSIFAMLAIKWLGTRAGVLVAAVGGAYTLVLWHHPYAWLIIVAEALCVGLLRTHLRPRGEVLPLAALDGLFWVVLGMPLVALCYGGPLAMSGTEVLLVAFKQAINGVLNAALAGALAIGIQGLRRRPVAASISDFLFVTLVLAVLMPALVVTIWQNHRLTEAMEREVAATLALAIRLTTAEFAARHPPPTPATARDALPALVTRITGLIPQAQGLHLALAAPTGDPHHSTAAHALAEPSPRPGLQVRVAEHPGYSLMVRWRKGHYRMQAPLTLAGQPLELVAELAATQAVKTLQGVQLGVFWRLGVIILLALTGAFCLSRRIGQPIAALAEAARHLPARLAQADPTPPPRPSRLRETADLAAAFARMESALRENFKALAQSRQREVIGHLAGGVAHDFNNVLGAIGNNLEYLKRLLPADTDGHEAREVLDETQAAIGQAKVVTSGLLSLGRGEDHSVGPCDLGTLVEAFAPLVRRLLPPGIELTLELEPGVGALVNPALLQAALLNLALNSRDAMGACGHLTLSVAARLEPHPEPADLGDPGPGERAELCVRDTGVGMTEAVRARIFEPLFSTKSRGRGTGLGLFMVREFALRSRGAIQVHSVPGVRTCVRLWLPRTRLPAEVPRLPVAAVLEPADAPPSPMPPQPQRCPLLVVDDDQRVRNALSRVLEAAGYRVLSAADGADALDRLAAEPTIALVLSDIAMPRMDGLALYGALCCGHPQLPVILMTGDPSAATDAAAMDPGALVLRKPLDHRALVELIRAVLAGERQPQETMPPGTE